MNLKVVFPTVFRKSMCMCFACTFGAVETLGLILLDQEGFGFKNTRLASGGVDLSRQKSMTVPLYLLRLVPLKNLLLVRGELLGSSEMLRSG